jgi:hypothetical protein
MFAPVSWGFLSIWYPMKLSQSFAVMYSGLFLGTLITMTPAQSITVDEVFRLFGVWGCYYDDLQRNFNAALALVVNTIEPENNDIDLSSVGVLRHQ